jgi:hypothetical protein
MNGKCVTTIVLAMLASGCATMSNPGGVRSAVTPEGAHVRVARVYLKNTNGHIDIFEGNRRLAIQEGTGDRNGWLRLCRETNNFGDGGSCDDLIFFPMIELDRNGPHTLRIVHKGQEVSTTVEAHTHWAWIWANGVWFAAAPVGWAVDAASGAMQYYGSLDVGRLLREASGTR